MALTAGKSSRPIELELGEAGAGYLVLAQRVRGGVVVYVIGRGTGACVWHLPLAWPPTPAGLAELRDCKRHAPGLGPQALERALHSQLRQGRR